MYDLPRASRMWRMFRHRDLQWESEKEKRNTLLTYYTTLKKTKTFISSDPRKVRTTSSRLSLLPSSAILEHSGDLWSAEVI